MPVAKRAADTPVEDLETAASHTPKKQRIKLKLNPTKKQRVPLELNPTSANKKTRIIIHTHSNPSKKASTAQQPRTPESPNMPPVNATPEMTRMQTTPSRRILQGIKMEEEEPVAPFTPRRSARLAQKAIVKIMQ